MPLAVVIAALLVLPAAVAVQHPVFISPSRVYGAWAHERVDPSVGWPFSVEFDAEGRMHAAWLHYEPDYSWSSLRYGIRDGELWSFVDVPGHKRPQEMVLTAAGEARIIAFALPEERMYYYEFDTQGGWTREAVGGTRDGIFANMVLDQQDRPHVVYASAGGMRYATKDASGAWRDEKVANSALTAWSDITLGNDGTVHIFYTIMGPTLYGLLAHAHRLDDGTWVHETVDAQRGTDQSAITDQTGRIHVAYAGYGEVLRYGVLKDGLWELETVDHDAPTGLETSIGVDSEGRVHIAYYQLFNRANPNDPFRGHVKYATKSATSDWVTEFLHPTHAASDPALTLDDNGQPHILYLDRYALITGELHHALMYARPAAAAVDHAVNAPSPFALLQGD